MAKKAKTQLTPALRVLQQAGVEFEPLPYDYTEHGGTAHAAAELKVDEHQVIKTLVMADDRGQALIILMHGDREVSTKALARTLGVKSVDPVTPDKAFKLTGYQVGGISPLGARQALPVYVERTVLDLPDIYLNGGRRGLLVRLKPRDLAGLLDPTPVSAAQAAG